MRGGGPRGRRPDGGPPRRRLRVRPLPVSSGHAGSFALPDPLRSPFLEIDVPEREQNGASDDDMEAGQRVVPDLDGQEGIRIVDVHDDERGDAGNRRKGPVVKSPPGNDRAHENQEVIPPSHRAILRPLSRSNAGPISGPAPAWCRSWFHLPRRSRRFPPSASARIRAFPQG